MYPFFSSRNTLCDPEVIRYINIHTLFWACNVKSGEGYKVAEALKSGSYPFLALIVLKDNKMTIVGRYVSINTQKHKIVIFCKTFFILLTRFTCYYIAVWNYNSLREINCVSFLFLQNGRCTIFCWFNITFTNNHRT